MKYKLYFLFLSWLSFFYFENFLLNKKIEMSYFKFKIGGDNNENSKDL